MGKLDLPAVAWLVFVAAAALEVGGDAVVRTGLRGRTWWAIGAGCLMLAGYGLVVNLVRWDFSRLLGVYVGVFAAVSVLCGRFLFQEAIAPTTWVGLGLIVAGGVVIQLGQK
jgi:small multidrug resistance family-3 protein